MTALFIVVYYFIYLKMQKVNSEIGHRQIPVIFAEPQYDDEDAKSVLKKFAKKYIVPLAAITAIVVAAKFIFEEYAVVLYIVGAYLCSMGYSRKVRKINELDGEEIYDDKKFFRWRKRSRKED